MICHGQGDPEADPFDGGCCFVGGQVCPHRWFIDRTGPSPVVVDANRTELGTVDSFVSQVVNGKPRQDRIREAIQGAVYVCGALARTVLADGIPTGANWEADFDAAWSNAYAAGGIAADVGDAWASLGRPRNWCVSYGPGEGQCCFGEDQATNDARAAGLSVTRVQIASRSTLGG